LSEFVCEQIPGFSARRRCIVDLAQQSRGPRAIRHHQRLRHANQRSIGRIELGAEAKRVEQALLAIHEALGRVERMKERWCLAEALRIRGELALQIGSETEAQSYFRQALTLAHAQGALSWELRAGTSLARLYQTQGRPAPARAVLEPVLATFTEGLDSRDVTSAAGLLRSLQ